MTITNTKKTITLLSITLLTIIAATLLAGCSNTGIARDPSTSPSIVTGENSNEANMNANGNVADDGSTSDSDGKLERDKIIKDLPTIPN